jgi:FdrA protein
MENTVQNLLNEPLVAINLGLSGFADNLEDQDVEVVRVDWAPSAGGDQEMIDILDTLL